MGLYRPMCLPVRVMAACAVALVLLGGCGGFSRHSNGRADRVDNVETEPAPSSEPDSASEPAPSQEPSGVVREVTLIKGYDGAPLSYVVDGQGDQPDYWDSYEVSSRIYFGHDGLYYPIISPYCDMLGGSLTDFSGNLVDGVVVAYLAGEQTSTADAASGAAFDMEPLPLNLSAGDTLITTDSIIEEPCLVPIDTRLTYTSDSGFGSIGDFRWYDEVAGVSLEGIDDYDERGEAIASALEAQGVHMVEYAGSYLTGYALISDEPLTITVGRYSGTQWEQQEVSFYRPVVWKPAEAHVITLDVTRTRDGYFAIETDGVPSGDYMLCRNRGGGSAYRVHVE